MELFPTPSNPVPSGAVCGRIVARDGVGLRFARFPATKSCRGTVCLFGGRTEQAEKYFETIADLRRRGFAVATLDWRGQGGSDRLLKDPRKGFVRAFDDYELDLEVFIREVVYPDCPPPYFALAHSMGGAILIRAAKHSRRWFDRTVAVSPMIRIRLPAYDAAWRTVRLLRAFGLGRLLVPGGKPGDVMRRPFDGNKLTSDSARYARNAEIIELHPDLGLGAPTVAWVDEAFRAAAEFADPAYPSTLRHPILIVAAGNDEVVSTLATDRFAIRLLGGAGLVIPGARHEILQERTAVREQFWAAFDAFVPGSGA
ncbi:alpha/beta fold hydrolase [Blastochloris viridis]|uniref:Lysophospholipase L2 n=1 Tax=Blastochloris viridis TaxID=1079 RepID=A0A0H5BBU9_BLAVI|nr:alpha/beta hydrolase [Blastochloris viridis]ALK10329.1 lysophospholipase L2 [Blastochloris viridis]BAR99737.1 lysophospholipase L2 [Blastochloris viridis]CUU42991.1 lysophospholipase L2 [Blastochloris viridis]